jgi:hypothetical protein
LRFHHAVWTSFCSSSADAIDKERSSSDLSMGRWPVANCAARFGEHGAFVSISCWES